MHISLYCPKDHDIFMKLINLPVVSAQRVIPEVISQMNSGLKQHMGFNQDANDLISWHAILNRYGHWSGEVLLVLGSPAHARGTLELFNDQLIPSTTSSLSMTVKLVMRCGWIPNATDLLTGTTHQPAINN